LVSAQADQTTIRILHINDFHGFAGPYKAIGSDSVLGGIAYLAGKADKLRAEKPSLLLAAGDVIQGSNWANFTKGASVIELMNMMRFDAMVVGNHEFDFGQDVLKKRITEARFPVLGANVEGFDSLKPYIIKEIAGIRVAVIGIVTDETPVTTDPRNVAGLRFISPEVAVKQYLEELKNKADIFIVLSHIGYHEDRLLAERVRGIDVIVGGHSHTKLLSPAVIGSTIIVQAWEHAKALGVLDLEVENKKIVKFDAHLEEIRPEPGEENRSVLELEERYEKQIDSVLAETVGEALVGLDGENVRRRETNLGDLVADIMKSMSGADAAIINGGSIRANIRKGEIKTKDVYTALPFDNYVVAVKLRGGQIREALEHGVSAIEQEGGRFPQVSGIKFTFSRSKRPGMRVGDVTIGATPIEADREYVVATNDFLAVGGDGYKVFQEALKPSEGFSVTGGAMRGEKIIYSNSGRWLRDLVIDYIKQKRGIASPTDDRIKEIP
jgi:2',3'-cyclic-nucleotide 2'-phosphodiesterase (5'-nucleotidase family)